MRYRRARVNGGTYFFTVVTCKRRRILTHNNNVSLLRKAFRFVMKKYPFKVDAMVVLPEHLHCIWTLPQGDRQFSTRWRLIKNFFTRNCEAKYKQIRTDSLGRTIRRQGIWQGRFWEHLIRDDRDFANHVEYTHYNPVKHGFVSAPIEWPYSSFRKYVRQGLYEAQWGAGQRMEFGLDIGAE
ncbi:MAG: transposase [Desulfobacteraceae bacterium]|nr:transposase [Desulfobacteraceae bacterium]